MHFEENQLSRNLIGLSPLAPGHPPGFQPRWVRSSTRSYPRFNLPRARSSRFGSRTSDYKRLLRLAFATHTPHGLCSPHATDSQTHFSIGTPSPHQGGSDGSRAHGFRNSFTPLPGCFSPFPHGTRTLSVRQVYSGLPDGPGGFTRDSTSPALLGRHHPWCTRIRLRGHHPLRPGIQPGSPHACIYHHSQRRRPLDRRSHDTMRATPDGYHTRTV